MQDGFFQSIFVPRVDDGGGVSPGDLPIRPDFHPGGGVWRTACKYHYGQGSPPENILYMSNKRMARIVARQAIKSNLDSIN
jgi:hypothetical protein